MTHLRPVSLVIVLALAVLPLLATGCGEGEPREGSGAAAPADGAPSVIDRYTVRGEVVSLPVAGDPRSGFQVHHERIPDFRDMGTGEVKGMNPMAMGFPLAEGVSLEGLQVGDPVELVIEAPRMGSMIRVTTVTPLPEGTLLDLTTRIERPDTSDAEAGVQEAGVEEEDGHEGHGGDDPSASSRSAPR